MQPEVIASRYEVIEQISDSNMAVVYRAFDRRDQKLVAIKRLKLPTTEKESRTRLIEHFRQEAQILEQFKDHPHVVDLIDFNEEDGDPYIVMEYVGNSLRKMINSSAGQLPTSLVVSIAYDLARMLQEAHEAKIIHCDIKPSNVLVTDMGLAKLADFGVAFLPNQLGRGIVHDGVAFGTPLYWPPEASSKA
ncbi:MAG: serine/threonine protein kinase, partial [Anaerolineae bacterium]|nr:serine/threonine protein kinase [Anaerolineae bacterium]